MTRKLILAAILAALGGQALAADLDAAERRRLDYEVLHGHHRVRRVVRGYVEPATPYFAAPPSYYARRGTARICIDDADGVTCSYKNFDVR